MGCDVDFTFVELELAGQVDHARRKNINGIAAVYFSKLAEWHDQKTEGVDAILDIEFLVKPDGNVLTFGTDLS